MSVSQKGCLFQRTREAALHRVFEWNFGGKTCQVVMLPGRDIAHQLPETWGCYRNYCSFEKSSLWVWTQIRDIDPFDGWVEVVLRRKTRGKLCAIKLSDSGYQDLIRRAMTLKICIKMASKPHEVLNNALTLWFQINFNFPLIKHNYDTLPFVGLIASKSWQISAPKMRSNERKREDTDSDKQVLSVTLFCLVILMKTTSTIRRETDGGHRWSLPHLRFNESTDRVECLCPSAHWLFVP